MRAFALLPIAFAVTIASAKLPPYQPTTQEISELQRRSANLGNQVTNQVLNWNLTFTWIDNDRFYYRRQLTSDTHRFTVFSVNTKSKSDLFDHTKLASALALKLNREVSPDRLPIQITRVNGENITLTNQGKSYNWDAKTNTLTDTPQPAPEIQNNSGQLSPDRQSRARVNESDLQIRPNQPDSEWMTVATIPHLNRILWSPDSRYIIAQTQIPGDRKTVSFLNSATPNATRAVLTTRLYDQPGDKLDASETHIYNFASRKVTKVAHEPIICGGHPWSSPPPMRTWYYRENPTILIEFDIRGFQQKKVIEINPESAQVTEWIDEKSPTFIHLSNFFFRPTPDEKSLIFQSERTGWSHLYRYTAPGKSNPVTSGNYVVRDIEHLTNDEVIFSANHREPGDPYFIHYYRTQLNGTGLTHLTPSPGHHQATFNPNFTYFIDKSSTVSKAPTYILRDRTGKSISPIESSDAKPLREAGIAGPTEFVAKGRDGATDIYGIIHFPTQMDPAKSYPIIEDIYAGPHDSHVPKAFTAIFGNQRLAELGFIVVQIDGMGTANRGKKFHDVAWKNVADAGLPDRIAWIKAAAEKFPQMDTSRVGIYGTSAGGQNSTGALLFHPEFYKVAVSSCGCHDNRMDKFWWNEQWMGYPVGPHYNDQSNITNAAKLQGNLLLMVGEIDSNVPPESTFRLADALIKANKDFEFVYLPGYDHTGGGAFGERKRRDFFIRHLHRVTPPQWNN
jgi:dipeptidyl aminopeptidase/acylaminoacyl peptidase